MNELGFGSINSPKSTSSFGIELHTSGWETKQIDIWKRRKKNRCKGNIKLNKLN